MSDQVITIKTRMCSDGKVRRVRGLAEEITAYLRSHGEGGSAPGIPLTYKRVAHTFRTSPDYVRAA